MLMIMNLFMRTKEAVKKLPEAIRKDEICELIANLVSTIIKLKRDYELEKKRTRCWCYWNNPLTLVNVRNLNEVMARRI